MTDNSNARRQQGDENLRGKVRTYYGEYSLAHWIKMLLNKEIVLPPYQRRFVWTPDKALALVESFDKGLFVPSVTIAYGSQNFSKSGEQTNNKAKANLLLDGQQRLTSLLMFRLGIWPEVDSELTQEAETENETDYNAEDTEEDAKLADIGILKKIQTEYEACGDIDALRKRLWDNKRLDNDLVRTRAYLHGEFKPEFKAIFDEAFLGYGYMRGAEIDETLEKRFYSSIFRNINMLGIPLKSEEYRAALYWLAPDKVGFFAPNFITKYRVKRVGHEEPYDFVRALAFVSEGFRRWKEKEREDWSRVAVGYGKKNKPYEAYFEVFINSIIEGAEGSSEFEPCPQNWEKKLKNLEAVLIKLWGDKGHSFNNIADADNCFFGLIYCFIYGEERLEAKHIDSLRNFVLAGVSAEAKNASNPNRIGFIRDRLNDSANKIEWMLRGE